jgi:5-methylcytosine-specific restriction endonuclease McrA
VRPKIQSLKPSLKSADLRRVKALGNGFTSGRSEDARRCYHSGRWVNRVRPDKLKRDPLCQACAAKGLVVEATEVDHWLAISQGGDPWADSNLVSLCKRCHSFKTRCEQTGDAFPPIVASTPRTFTIA